MKQLVQAGRGTSEVQPVNHNVPLPARTLPDSNPRVPTTHNCFMQNRFTYSATNCNNMEITAETEERSFSSVPRCGHLHHRLMPC